MMISAVCVWLFALAVRQHQDNTRVKLGQLQNTWLTLDAQTVVARVENSISGADAAAAFCRTLSGLASFNEGRQCAVLANGLEQARQREPELVPTVTVNEKAQLTPLVLLLDSVARGIQVAADACSPAALQHVGGVNAIIEAKWRRAWNIPSDINEHIMLLTDLALECSHITDVGVRSAVATAAFLRGLTHANRTHSKNALAPRVLRMHDLELALPALDIVCLAHATDVKAQFIIGDILSKAIEPTDLLFIDSLHCFGQLKRELARMAPLVRKYIVLHDTTVDADVGECVRMSTKNMDNATYTKLVLGARTAAASGGGERSFAAARMGAFLTAALGGQPPSLCAELASKTGIPLSELQLGLWPAVENFLEWNPQWELLVRRTNNNGLTVLRRRALDKAAAADVGISLGAQ